MAKKPLLRQLYPSYLLIVIISLVTVTIYSSFVFSRFHLKQTETDLEVIALTARESLNQLLQSKDPLAIDAYCKRLGNDSPLRITVIEPSGTVLGDSEENPAMMSNHADRPEIRQAFRGESGTAIHFSNTLKMEMLYVAVPILKAGEVQAVLRTSLPVTTISQALRSTITRIMLAGLLIIIIAGGISLIISRKITRPLEEMTRGAERFSAGDFSSRLHEVDSLELGELARAMNLMAGQLDDRISTIVKQRGELEAVLASMVEGVIAIDRSQRILSMNDSAAGLLGVVPAQAQGQLIESVVRNPGLQQFMKDSLDQPQQLEREISLQQQGEKFLQALGTALRDATGEQIGALVVLHDVTQLRKLELFRRDFVANVSHELRTPITLIKGFVETLADGALDDRERAINFLEIISRHTDRLSDLIEDLLALSRLEREESVEDFRTEQLPVLNLLEASTQSCRIKANTKRIALEISCDPSLLAKLNTSLAEQAVINLIDNAIKYSDEGAKIQIAATQNDAEIVISVQDHGCGIEGRHLSRLFERFYRVDQARSRELGGTGLGLAIVKHIAQVHGGSVSVESELGQGSTFYIRLPGIVTA